LALEFWNFIALFVLLGANSIAWNQFSFRLDLNRLMMMWWASQEVIFCLNDITRLLLDSLMSVKILCRIWDSNNHWFCLLHVIESLWWLSLKSLRLCEILLLISRFSLIERGISIFARNSRLRISLSAKKSPLNDLRAILIATCSIWAGSLIERCDYLGLICLRNVLFPDRQKHALFWLTSDKVLMLNSLRVFFLSITFFVCDHSSSEILWARI
jgi:hypothetical protein